jgi:hypothetical protein
LLLAERRTDGLLGAGVGAYRADGSVDETARPAWVSTEHNMDAWQTLRLAAQVLGNPDLALAADRLADAVVSQLWGDGRLREGLDPGGAPDDTDPLDTNSWGALFLRSSGHTGLADQAVNHLAAFASTAKKRNGYRAYHPQPAFPNVTANVWAEGGAGVVMARLRAADTVGANADLSDLAALQRTSGAFPYALVADASTGMTDALSVSATCWFVLATRGFSGPTIWD